MPAGLSQSPEEAARDSIGVLNDLAISLRGRVRKKSFLLVGGTTLTHQLRALYRGHKIELLANENWILVDVEARFGQFGLFKINQRRAYFGRPAATVEAAGVKHAVFTIDGNLSHAQAELYDSGALKRLLDVISPLEGEEIDVSQRLVRVYLQRPNRDRVMGIIHAVIDLMPHGTTGTTEYANLPDALRPLVPFISKWAIDDDEERSRKLSRCARSTRQKLVDVVVPLVPAIDKFLDTFGANPPEEACALGSLAQAALEAQSLLKANEADETVTL
jgi:hypothetical protein